MSKSLSIKKLKFVFIAFVVFLFFAANLTPINLLLPHSGPYFYVSDNGKFASYERGKAREPYASLLNWFAQYKKQTNKQDLILHRRFHRHWWQVWNWVDFMTHPRWDMPYAESDENS
jgi:hypothetical protein